MPRQRHNKRNSPPITRRQFLKEVSLVVGGVAVASLAFTSACHSSANTTPWGTITNTDTTTNTSTPPTGGTTTNTISVTNTSTGGTASPTATTATTTFSYAPSTEGLEYLSIPGCTTRVASDRLYSIEHMWIKPLADDKAAIGITDKLQELMGVVNSLDFPREGEVVAGGEFCGYAESWKMNVDFICPVSGTVLQVNTALQWGLGSKDHVFHIDPYVTGWMMVIQLSKPEELNGLLTPEEYIALNAKVAP